MGHSPMYIEERNKKMGLTVAKAHKRRGDREMHNRMDGWKEEIRGRELEDEKCNDEENRMWEGWNMRRHRNILGLSRLP